MRHNCSLSNHTLYFESGGFDETISLFGSLSYILIFQGSLSVVIIVFAVLAVEKAFHGLHTITHDTPFADMVSAIEKEMMIVGCMAFIFKIIISTSSFLNADWLHALEFAGIKIIHNFCFFKSYVLGFLYV